MWELVRRDDHGTIFIVITNSNKEVLDKLAKEYEAKGHKQMYWVRPYSLSPVEFKKEKKS